MKLIILGGFLGSGKTTALMQFAKYLVDASDSARENKVIIIENEVGEVGIDDVYLRGGGFSVSNLFSGCACCTVSGELVSSVTRIRDELDPEWIILETTGIAYPRLIQENLQHGLGLSSSICILVDAARWSRLLLPMNALLRGQIEGSDCVFVNKIDLVSDEQLEAVEKDILGFEPKAVILRIAAAQPVPTEIWKTAVETGGKLL
jgi:G3E family GTPase